MKMQSLLLCSIVLLSTPALTAAADSPPKADKAATASTAPLTQGEVRKVDKEAAKITIQHGPIVNLDMTGMTMTFRVRDLAMLDGINPGDRIRFTAEKIGGALMVTQLERAK